MVHVVKAGETLGKIAKKYNTSVAAIQAANSVLIKDVNNIKTGWALNIPSGTVSDTKVKNALNKCLDAIENLPEFQNLTKML